MADNNNTPANQAPGLPDITRESVPAASVFPDLGTLADTSPAKKPDAVPAPAPKPADATPAKPADAKPADAPKPADATPAKPADATPAKPADATLAKAADKPETKVKIGDKEYTQAELEKALAERSQPVPAPAPVAAPAPEVKPPTPEEIAKKESDWMTKFVTDEKLNFAPTEEEMETLLAGGKEAVTFFGKKLTDLVSKTVMLARKSLWSDSLQPIINRLQAAESAVHPLTLNQQQLEAVAAEQQFFAAYPDYKSHAETVRQVGEALIARFPEKFFALTREQQLQEVATQTDRILQTEYKRWNPNVPGTWRDALKTPSPVPAAAAPAVPAAAPIAPPVPAPASNSPAAVPAAPGGNPDKDWHKRTAASLV